MTNLQNLFVVNFQKHCRKTSGAAARTDIRRARSVYYVKRKEGGVLQQSESRRMAVSGGLKGRRGIDKYNSECYINEVEKLL